MNVIPFRTVSEINAAANAACHEDIDMIEFAARVRRIGQDAKALYDILQERSIYGSVDEKRLRGSNLAKLVALEVAWGALEREMA